MSMSGTTWSRSPIDSRPSADSIPVTNSMKNGSRPSVCTARDRIRPTVSVRAPERARAAVFGVQPISSEIWRIRRARRRVESRRLLSLNGRTGFGFLGDPGRRWRGRRGDGLEFLAALSSTAHQGDRTRLCSAGGDVLCVIARTESHSGSEPARLCCRPTARPNQAGASMGSARWNRVFNFSPRRP